MPITITIPDGTFIAISIIVTGTSPLAIYYGYYLWVVVVCVPSIVFSTTTVFATIIALRRQHEFAKALQKLADTLKVFQRINKLVNRDKN